VVALRNAWKQYVEVEGNTRIYAYPGCSIEPFPETYQRLEALTPKIQGGAEDGLEEWDRVCREPQKVLVLGVPFHTHFAQVMVEADYQMKTHVDGTDELEVPGLVSLADITLARIRQDVEAQKPISVPVSTSNRFWFYPGENVFEEHSAGVIILESPVILRSRLTHVDSSGQIVDAAARDPLAEDFAKRFSAVFEEVAFERPLYQELEALFRFFALAQVLEAKIQGTLFEEALDYLLREYPVTRTPVDETLPGRPSVAGFELEREVPGGREILTLRLPGCGGVDMAIRADREQFQVNTSGLIEEVRDVALRDRDGVSWIISRNESGSVDDLERSLHVRQLNRGNREVLFFTVSDEIDNYRVYSGFNDPIYVGNDIRELVARVNEAQAKVGATQIYIELLNFSLGRQEFFASTSRIQQDALRPDVSIRTLDEIVAEMLSTPNAQLVEGPSPITINESGEHKGWYQATARLQQRMRGHVRQFTITLIARTKAILEVALKQLLVWLDPLSTGPISPGDLFQNIRQNLRRDLGITDEDLDILIEDEVGGTHLVENLFVMDRRAA